MGGYIKSAQIREVAVIARRALCLGTLLTRLELELFEKQGFQMGGMEFNQYLLTWLEEAGLLFDLSETEKDYLFLPFGTWTETDLTRLIWYSERFGVLLWLLCRLDDLPPVDTPMALYRRDLTDLIPLMEPLDAVMHNLYLRESDEIARMDDRLTTYAYRMAIRSNELDLPSADGSIRETIKREAEALYKIGSIQRVIDGDLPAFGMAVGALPAEQRRLLHYIIEHRLGTLSWAQYAAVDWALIGPK